MLSTTKFVFVIHHGIVCLFKTVPNRKWKTYTGCQCCVCVCMSVFFHSFFSVVQLIPSTETRVNFRCCRFFRFCCYCCYFRESGIIFFFFFWIPETRKKRPIWSNLPVIRFVYFRIFLLLLLLFLPHHQNGNRIWKRTKKKLTLMTIIITREKMPAKLQNFQNF